MYIVYRSPERYRQLSFEELLSGVVDYSQLKYGDPTSTTTVQRRFCPDKLMKITKVDDMITGLKRFNEYYKEFTESKNLERYYYRFQIPKKSGGLRDIDTPKFSPLGPAQTSLRELLDSWMIANHHTSAFAYTENRSCPDAVARHQQWGSWWFGDFDFHGFFPSTTPDFVYRMLSQIYPFALICEREDGRQELKKALSICFLRGGLPQGTTISPWLTNVMMIPFDYKLTKKLRSLHAGRNGRADRFIYTRYADDICISCRTDFDIKMVQDTLLETMRDVNAPFTLNEEKTHYGSRNGKNFRLGVILNRHGDIGVGHVKMKHFKAMVHNYLMDKRNGVRWEPEDVQKLQGLANYYKSIYKNGNHDGRVHETANDNPVLYITHHYSIKTGVDFEKSIKEDLAG